MSLSAPMPTMLRTALTCHWAGRRLHRYLDADPSAPLTEAEAARMREHLAVCERCSSLAAEHRALRDLLNRWGATRPPDPDSVDRLRTLVRSLGEREAR